MNKKLWIDAILLVLSFSILILGYFLFFDEKKILLQDENLVIYSWEGYFTQEALSDFEKIYGIKIDLIEYSDEYEALDNIINGSKRYDLIVVSDFLVKELIKEDLLTKINIERIDNFKNINSFFLDRSFDPKNKYSVPYMWGTTGIIYNKKHYNPYDISSDYLWDENNYKNIGVIPDFEEIYYAASIHLGIKLPLKNIEEFRQIEREILEQRDYVKIYPSFDGLGEDLVDEKITISLIYSDLAFGLIEENEDLIYRIPREGGTVWIDNFAIPKSSENRIGAVFFIDYINNPVVNSKLTEELLTSTCNQAAYYLLSEEYFEKNFENFQDLENLQFLSEVQENFEIEILKENLKEKLDFGGKND